MDTYTQLIHEIRARGATHAGIANALGVARTTVQSWEGRNSIPPDRWNGLIRYAETLGVVVTHATLVHMAEVAGSAASEAALLDTVCQRIDEAERERGPHHAHDPGAKE